MAIWPGTNRQGANQVQYDVLSASVGPYCLNGQQHLVGMHYSRSVGVWEKKSATQLVEMAGYGDTFIWFNGRRSIRIEIVVCICGRGYVLSPPDLVAEGHKKSSMGKSADNIKT